MIDNVEQIVAEVNSTYASELWLDFEVVGIDDGVLTLKASKDFTYAHQCELTFSGLRYFQGPMTWGSDPGDGLMETLPDSETLELINLHELDTPCSIIAFKTDNSTKVLIGAASISVNWDTVYYYNRENLGPNERIDEKLNVDQSGM